MGRYTTARFVIVDEDLRQVRVAGLFKRGDVAGFLSTLEANFDIVHARARRRDHPALRAGRVPAGHGQSVPASVSRSRPLIDRTGRRPSGKCSGQTLNDWRKTRAQSSESPEGRRFAAAMFRTLRAPCARLRQGCLTIVFCACSQPQAGDTLAFDIPRQRADLALIAFAEQANRTLLFSFDETSRRTTNRLRGDYEVLEALELLLAGTGLSISMGIQGQLTVAEAAGPKPETAKPETVMQRPTSILGRLGGRIGILLTGAFVGSSAMAQQSADAGDGGIIEEIVVTAQKRSENLQEVPISITALTSADIDTHRFRDPGDLSAQTPNMSTSTVQGAGTPVFGLRGVSMNDWSYNQSGPVAVYLDEGYKGNPSLLAVPFFDLERVEVLRGPQGTLYGKNTTGGASTSSPGSPTWRATRARSPSAPATMA